MVVVGTNITWDDVLFVVVDGDPAIALVNGCIEIGVLFSDCIIGQRPLFVF